MKRIVLGTVFAVIMAGCARGPQAAVLPPVQTVAQATARTVLQATVKNGASWGINDGIILNDMEQRVFDALPKALKPTPGGTPAYRNLISNFAVRPQSGNPAFIGFSGVRLVETSEFVHSRPSFETFFSGVFEAKTGKATVYREAPINDR